MHKFKEVMSSVIVTVLGASCFSFDTNTTVAHSPNEEAGFYIEPQESFSDVVQYMKDYLDAKVAAEGKQTEAFCGWESETGHSEDVKEFNLEIAISSAGIKVKPVEYVKSQPRNYNTPVSSGDREKIRYIVTTLGFESILKITSVRSDLKKKGKQIDHLHPFRFLMTIFTDEEMKAAAHAIRGRMIGWIWDEFLGGIAGSLKEEAANHNLKPEYIQDFAKKLGISADLITPAIQNEQWKEFVDILIDHVPRQNDPNRYNM